MASPKRKLKEVLLDPEDEHLRPWLLICSDGYVDLSKNYTRIKIHKVILKVPAGFIVDHINGDKCDNRKENLRICTQSDNCANRKKRTDKATSSKYKGVSRCKQTSSWKAAITVQGMRITIGRFKSELDAALAYNKAAFKYFGEFALINIVED